jgi:hypothetical protein
MNPLAWRTRFFSILFAGTAAASVFVAASCGAPARNDCNDGFDNDGDGLIDGADPGCELNGDLEAPDPVLPQCNDGVDNDGDALVDFPDDPGCASEDDDDEFNEPVPAQCSDGMDNDGDGRIDYPNDPGCDFANTDDETDDCPDGPDCPECSDGIDNDNDGETDYPSDPGCGFAADADEFNTIPGVCGPSVDVIPLPADGIVMGQHLGSVPNELQSPDCSGRGGETVYTLTVSETASLFVSTDYPETTLDTVVYVRGECRNPDTELGCNDDAEGLSKVSTLLIPVVEPGVYYIVVDAFGPGSIGDYKLEVRTFKGEGEECDPEAVPDECPPGLVCRLELPTDTVETCVEEECIDGNDNDGDTFIDFPNDPGCTGESDNDETDDCPDGASCPQCGNGEDDDGDTFIDYPDDPGCTSANDNVELDECVPGVEVLEIPGGEAMGTTVGGSMLFTASCDSDSSMSPERIHGFRTTFPLVSLTFSTTASFANTLYVRAGTCDVGPDVACAPNTDGGTSRTVTIAAPTVGTNYFAFVDGDWSTSGTYTLNVSGKIPGGDACTPGDPAFTCELGYFCNPGTSVCDTAVCNNGADDDGDGFTDWPNDPGCANLSDADETDDCPAGAGCPECGNEVDDDADSFIDYPDDPGCISAADGNEIDECITGVEVLELDPELGATGTTSGTSMFTAGCSSSSSSPEVVYAYRLTRALTNMRIDTTGSLFDTVTSVRLDTCDSAAAEIACADPDSGGEILNLPAPVLGTYFIFVDGNFAMGTYDLQLSGTIPNGDACDPSSGAFRCGDGYICSTGSLTCVETQCNDGADNDGDTLADAADPGCASILDNSESPDPSPLPECSNGVDDDADSFTDYPDDPGCSRASDDLELDCTESDPVVEVVGTPTTGTTVGATNDFVPSCIGGSTAPEIVHTLQIPGELSSLSIDTFGSSYDTAVYMKSAGCDGADIACDDDDGSLQSRICTTCTDSGTAIPSPVPAGVYFIFVDGFSTASGAYTLNISGTIASGAECDPAQIAAGIFTCAAGTACLDDAGTTRCM